MSTYTNKRRASLSGVSLLAGTLFLCGPAVAADYPATFESVDTDGNGYISDSEAKARPDLSQNWKDIDTNADNQLNITEFDAFESRGRYTPPEESEEAGLGAAPY